ncbi:MAG: iron ABC transporter permease [Chloroflexi bacterium]|nr:iron ABC transporter permease [Chloroflexota bacterium]
MVLAKATEPRIVVVGEQRARATRPPAVIWIPAALVGVGMVFPIAYLILRTLGAGTEAWDLLFRSRTLDILIRSALLVVAVTGASVAIAVPLAWLTVRTDLPFRRAWSVITVLPLVIPSYVGGFLVVVALGPKGVLQGWLAPLGVERLPEIFGFPGAMLTLTLLSYPYVLLPVRAVLGRLDPTLEETSRSLGKGPWATFFQVALPLLRPAIAAGALLVALYTLSDFGAVSLLHYETFTWAIHIQYGYFARDLAAALSLVLVTLALGILIVETRTRGQYQYHRSTTGVVRPPSSFRLGRWRWPALALCAAVVLFSLVMPMSVLGYWVVRGVSAGEPLLLLWSHARNSLYVSGLAAAMVVVAALPIAILTVRYPSRISGLLERFSYVGFALPGIVVALALVFFGVRYATSLYQTLGLLIFAYVVLFLPTAVGAVRTSLLQVSHMVEEAARSLGRTPFRVFATITFPLVRPGILAGAALVFLLAMKELPATLILSPIGFKTLATSIWGATEDGFFAQAAAPALLLILASSIPMTFLVLRGERKS